jgi:hypothetical protein
MLLLLLRQLHSHPSCTCGHKRRLLLLLLLLPACG